MKFPYHLFSVITVCLISGCKTLEDVSYDRHATQQLGRLANASFETGETAATLKLSELVSLGQVSKLIDTALLNNPNLQQTLLTLKKAQKRLNITSAQQWPTLSASLNANKQQSNSALYTSSLDVSWTVDIWQSLSDATQAEKANLAATAFAYQGARDLLVANVIKAYLELVQLAQLIEIERKRVETYQTNEKVIVERYRQGLMSLNELDTAKSSTQSAQATLVDHQAQYQQALRNLSLLTGVKQNLLSYSTNFADVAMPLEKMNTQNIGRRPDLQQAYQNIIASQYQHKVAYKALLPNLSLSASVGNSNNNLHEALFGSSAWQLLGNLTAPIFNAGKLTSEVEIAKLSAEQSYWAFQEKLLAAVNEVDNATAQEVAITKRLALTESALQSAKRSEQTYLSRYRQGTASFIDLLQIQQQTYSLQAQVTQLTYQRLNNRITLGLALGLGI